MASVSEMLKKLTSIIYNPVDVVLYLALAGSNPDDPTDFAIPILQ